MKLLMFLCLLIGTKAAFADLSCGIDEKLTVEKLSEDKVAVKVYGYKTYSSGAISKVPVLLYALTGTKQGDFDDDGFYLFNELTYTLSNIRINNVGELKIIKKHVWNRGGGRGGVSRVGWDDELKITAHFQVDNFEKSYDCHQTFP